MTQFESDYQAIDAHHHFWQYHKDEYSWISDEMQVLQRDFLPGHLRPELNVTGITGTVSVQARQTLEETRWLLELADKNPFILGVVGWVDLCSRDVSDQLAQYASNPKLVGVRHVVQDEPDECFLLRSDFLKGIRQLRDFELSYDILIFEKHLPVAADFVGRFPEHRFVLDHIAKPLIKQGVIEPWQSNIRKLAAFPNVFCKVSGMVTEADWQQWELQDFKPYLDTVFEAFGPERIMFGTDWPVCSVAASCQQVAEIVISHTRQFSESERRAIFGDNACKFYKLKKTRSLPLTSRKPEH